MYKRFFGISLVLLLLLSLTSLALAQDNTVQVGLSEFTIDMPDSIPAGMTTFEVSNNGSFEHNFRIEGEGVDQAFDTNLQAGESRTMEIELQPGSYTVYCPVGNHREQGMELQLTPTEAEMQPTEEATMEPTEEAMMEPTEEATMEATEEAMMEPTEEAMAEATPTPEAATLPETGGVSYPWTGIILLSLGAVLVIGGLSFVLARRTQ
jgi:hypothetical protein